jgi:hypothetical protein
MQHVEAAAGSHEPLACPPSKAKMLADVRTEPEDRGGAKSDAEASVSLKHPRRDLQNATAREPIAPVAHLEIPRRMWSDEEGDLINFP